MTVRYRGHHCTQLRLGVFSPVGRDGSPPTLIRVVPRTERKRGRKRTRERERGREREGKGEREGEREQEGRGRAGGEGEGEGERKLKTHHILIPCLHSGLRGCGGGKWDMTFASRGH